MRIRFSGCNSVCLIDKASAPSYLLATKVGFLADAIMLTHCMAAAYYKDNARYLPKLTRANRWDAFHCWPDSNVPKIWYEIGNEAGKIRETHAYGARHSEIQTVEFFRFSIS